MINNMRQDIRPFELCEGNDGGKASCDAMRDTKNVCEQVASPYRAHSHSEFELRALYDVVAGLHDDTLPAGHVVNLGTYRGCNACVMAMALRAIDSLAPLITIDRFMSYWDDAEEPDRYDRVFLDHKQIIDKMMLEDWIVSIRHDSLGVLTHFWGYPIRVAVVDTEHSYEQASKEIELLHPHIVSKGWLVFHDYRDRYSGVVRAVNEFLNSCDRRNRRYALLRADDYLFVHFCE